MIVVAGFYSRELTFKTEYNKHSIKSQHINITTVKMSVCLSIDFYFQQKKKQQQQRKEHLKRPSLVSQSMQVEYEEQTLLSTF